MEFKTHQADGLNQAADHHRHPAWTTDLLT